MNLLISTCSEKLSEAEFVMPILRIAGNESRTLHYDETDPRKFMGFSRIIICGTSLIDNRYLDDMGKFSWLSSTKIPVLGICSGMQIIAKQLGSGLIKSREIGMKKITTVKKNQLFEGTFEAYELHGNGVAGHGLFDVIAESETGIQAIKHKEKQIFGVLFHPEVRNRHIIENFLRLR